MIFKILKAVDGRQTKHFIVEADDEDKAFDAAARADKIDDYDSVDFVPGTGTISWEVEEEEDALATAIAALERIAAGGGSAYCINTAKRALQTLKGGEPDE